MLPNKFAFFIFMGGLCLMAVFFAFETMNNAQPPTEGPVVAATPTERYTLPAEGLEFAYPAGDDGYTLRELEITESEPLPVRTVRLLPTQDYLDEQNRVGGEGSPSWLLSIYNNDLMLQPAQWVDVFPVASNIAFALGAPVETVVGGANAVSYRTDGLYPAQVYVIAHAGFIYVAQAAFMDESARTFTEHEAWLQSFTFTPIAQPQSGKLDPRVACESALAYMTFENGEAAEAFVEACVAGEHPEVTERYINDMGLDGAAI